MIELVMKLIDRCIELVKRREEQDHFLFEKFVAPAFADFEKVHEAYIDSMIKYREMIRDSTKELDPKHPVFQEILTDRLLTRGLKVKVESLKHYPPDAVTAPFINDILIYLRTPYARDQAGMMASAHSGPGAWMSPISADFFRMACSPMSMLYIDFYNLFAGYARRDPDVKREEAVRLVDFAISQRQVGYGEVLREFRKLEAKLLKPR